ncbi:type I pantothenate kinase [Candidatus Pantoea edessiphila]|uniref:Pantothenate kinase n=1 Tax=Candidatus Pantoea edessiphila TaxID=2044610 RepID=A0A2P5T334_9GAMM|nr:type I pantothenate kinase [Candidatus Pantoea edessiphila]PPI88963.1 type I pantothenate kinase [Candidatus Pantoea edessiphila]
MIDLYLLFTRKEWSNLRDTTSLGLSCSEIKDINAYLSISEIKDIYLPLLLLLNFLIDSDLNQKQIIEKFLGKKNKKTPYIISISGSVAVGKSTIANILQILLRHNDKNSKVELISTDGFLYPNSILKKRGLMKKKGFPQSYDMRGLIKFVSDLKLGVEEVTAPVYSHDIYDIVPKKNKIIRQPDILILEGLNILQNKTDYRNDAYHIFVSDFVDFSIYVDATEELLQNWYVKRFLKLCQNSFIKSNSYFHSYSGLPKMEVIKIARNLWREINGLNLKKNILPTKERANLILVKQDNHAINQIRLRK